MPKHLFPAAAEGMPIFNRRSILGLLPAWLVPAALAGSAALPAAPDGISALDVPPSPAAAWARLLASLDGVPALAGVEPEALRLLFVGSRTRLRVEISKLVMEPMHPRYPDRLIPVEHVFASYRMTDAGWQDEGIIGGAP